MAHKAFPSEDGALKLTEARPELSRSIAALLDSRIWPQVIFCGRVFRQSGGREAATNCQPGNAGVRGFA
jgi:hypothetical protein